MKIPATYLPINQRLAWIIVTGFWLFVAIISATQSGLTDYLRDNQVDFLRLGLFSMGWLLWIFLTFLILRLIRAFPIERAHLRNAFFTHLGFSFLVALLHLVMESTLMYTLLPLKNDPIPWSIWVLKFSYKFHINLLIYWSIVGVYYAFDYYNQSRIYQYEATQLELKNTQLEANLMQAQLQALKMQLNPHFLFNTHHAIMSLVLHDKKDEAVKMLNRLSDLLRLTLEDGQDQEVTLRQELELITLYLEIQQIRFENRLMVQWEIDKQVQHAKVPSMILQPLVENAIQHGIAPFARPGSVRLAAIQQGDQLLLSVQDDGPGLNGHFSEGIGLKNTRERLTQLYGKTYELRLANAPEGGFQATILIPFTL